MSSGYLFSNNSDSWYFEPSLMFVHKDVTKETFADLNLSTTYKFTDKWSGFIALKNVLNSDYETFSNYQVQGFQVLAGAVYSFDF